MAVPKQADSGEDRREEHRHSDHAGRDELQVAAIPGLLKDGAEAEAESQEIEQRLPQRGHDISAGTGVALQLAQPENVYGTHRLSPPHFGELPHLVDGLGGFVANRGACQRQESLLEGIALRPFLQFRR